jgi:hypothetical protein
MAIQLFAYAKSKGYDVKIYADTTAVSYTPFEFTVADWRVTYDSQDLYRPGILASRLEVTAPITQGTFTQNLETVLQDGDGIFYMTLSKNMGDLWKGYATPSAGTIEVINGQRFISLVAGDGFQLLNIPSDAYTYTGTKAFTDQIADIFERLNMWRVFNGFLVSKDLSRIVNSSGSYDSLFLCGTRHNGVYNTGTSFRSFREVLEGICAAFSLQMYQDKGYIVFRDFTKPESSFNVYNTNGTYQTNINYTGTQTMNVISGGTKMYQPPLRLTDIRFMYENEPYENIQDTYRRTIHYTYNSVDGTYTLNNYVDLGTFFADGVAHIDYDMDIKVLYQIPPGYNETVQWEIKMYFFLGDYTTDGTTWNNTTVQSVTLKINDHPSGDPGGPVPGFFVYSTNNQHLPTVPSIGAVSLGLYVEVTQFSGAPLDSIQPAEAKWEIVQHGSTSPYRGYRADNSRRKLGEDVTYTSYFGDLSNFGGGTPADQQIVYMGTSQTVSTWPSTWVETLPNGTLNSNNLLQITANRIAQRRSIPLEYYELDLHETSAVTHIGSWDSVEYYPVNIEYSHNGSRVTYAKITNLNIFSDPLRYDSEL